MPNRTIYLTQQNADNLSSEENMSGLVNRLLNNHYAGKRVIRPTQLVVSEEKMQKFEELKRLHPPLEIRKDFSEGQTVVPPELTA